MRARPVLLAALLGAPVAAAQQLDCVKQCRELTARGELRAGLSEQGCTLDLCHDEARRLYAAADYERAFAALEQIKPGRVTSPAYQLDRGLVEYARGHLDEALSAFEHVIESQPASLQAGAQRAHVLVRLERFADARAQLESLLALPASRTELQGLQTESYLRGNLGAIRLIENDAPAARVLLEKALEIDRGNTLAATYLYRLLPEVEADRMDGRAVWLMMLASEDAALRQLERARGRLDALLERAPRFAEAYYLQADILRAERKFEACEALMRRGEAQLPGVPGMSAERLRCQLYRVGAQAPETPALVAELEKLVREHRDDERIRRVLADLNE
jgi:tetratricopeptide (TPR) repeat protein